MIGSSGIRKRTHGWSDWSSVHLARNMADAAVREGRYLRKLYSIRVSSAK